MAQSQEVCAASYYQLLLVFEKSTVISYIHNDSASFWFLSSRVENFPGGKVLMKTEKFEAKN